ncbi:hypothetical protein FAY30_23940 [Bacillus sp. S3]|uniref:hypothetical protein n=1 Tax=Bacillus sp. S3 TaxID=486398 RepID=UPI00118ABCC5|nr:hypothetical protein [Bacillus sp. S3]QCJ44690.1 hypothetical protein FAY30_23940 [Bacillus sp. S3]
MLKRYDPQNPKMIRSAVCFTDILGFSQMVLDANQNGTGDQLLQHLHKILTQQYNNLKPGEDYVGIFKAFTDNIVIGLPIYEDGESQLGGIFLDFASFQLELTLNGFFIRGGIAIGDYYGDDEFAYGPSLIEAHYLEDKLAKFPRIILSENTVHMVKEHIKNYAEPYWAPQSRDILQDCTNQKWFINYLEAVMFDVHATGDYQVAIHQLHKHKKEIETNLIKYNGNTKVHPKYVWAAEYHNYFCSENIPQQFLNQSQLIITHQTYGSFSKVI